MVHYLKIKCKYYLPMNVRKYNNRNRRYTRNRKKVYRKKQVPRARLAKGLTQSITPFRRTVSQIIDTDQLSNLPANWAMSSDTVSGYHALLATQVFQFSQLPEAANLAAVWKFYKINCIMVKIYPCFASNVPNGATTTQNSASYQGQNIMCTYVKNQTGVGLSSTIDNNYWMTQQARKQRIITGTRPITFKVYPMLQNEVYASLTNTDYTLMKPKFIATTETSTPHYGLDMAWTFIDHGDTIRTDFESGYTTPIKFRMDMTYYLQMKGTH